MKQRSRVGYSPACCVVSVVRAACRALVKNRPVSVVALGENGPRVFVTCTREEAGLCQYARRSLEGTMIRATAVFGDAPGVDLAVGEGIAHENGVPVISAELLTAILAALLEESKGKSVRVVLSADAEDLSLLELPESIVKPKKKKTVVVLLGETDKDTIDVLKSRYGDESVQSASVFRNAVSELVKSVSLNVLFAGKLGDIAEFLGVSSREVTHLLSCFENGTSGFLFTSSPSLLKQARNQETVELLQSLFNEHVKTGILMTQS